MRIRKERLCKLGLEDEIYHPTNENWICVG